MARLLHIYKQTVIRIWYFRDHNPRSFIFLLSIITGIAGGLSAVILKNIVHLTGKAVFSVFDKNVPNFLVLALPGIGILLTVLFIRFLIRDNISHGITKVLQAISQNSSRIKPHNCYSSVIASTLTVGFGGSVGLEAPTVYTGAAIGSNIASGFRLNYKYRTLLIACGCSAAVAGIFKAPIAATIFALEVLMIDLSMWSIIPLLISSVTGATISYFLMGNDVMFSFTLYEPFAKTRIPFYILLGVFCGFLSIYFTISLRHMEHFFGKIKKEYQKIIIGGIALGIMIFLLPPLFGEGYSSLNAILGGVPEDIANNSIFYGWKNSPWLFLLFLDMVLLFKVFAGAATTGPGGIGGVFAPSLFMGGITGFIFSRAINNFNWVHLSERNFALVGMAGIMSGIMHAPLTSIFLIAEITGGYSLFIPLIITSTIAYLTKSYFDPHSVYTQKLAAEGSLITHHKDKALLQLLNTDRLIEYDCVTVSPDAKLGDLVDIISKSKRNVFPVVDAENKFVGAILLDDVREVMFNTHAYDNTHIKPYIIRPRQTLDVKDSAREVLNKFEISEAWNLPVLDNGKFVGMISKSRLLSLYRELLVQMSEE